MLFPLTAGLRQPQLLSTKNISVQAKKRLEGFSANSRVNTCLCALLAEAEVLWSREGLSPLFPLCIPDPLTLRTMKRIVLYHRVLGSLLCSLLCSHSMWNWLCLWHRSTLLWYWRWHQGAEPRCVHLIHSCCCEALPSSSLHFRLPWQSSAVSWANCFMAILCAHLALLFTFVSEAP